MKRQRLPARWVARLMKRQDGRCAVARCPVELTLKPRNFIDEHRVPLAIGGTNALKNRELRCVAHAKSKTYGSKATTYGSDVHDITKDRHIRTGKMTVKRTKRRGKEPTFGASVNCLRPWPKRKLQSRPFEKRVS